MKIWQFNDEQRLKLKQAGRSMEEIERLERFLPEAANDLAGQAAKSDVLRTLRSIQTAVHIIKNRLHELTKSTNEGWSNTAWNAFGHLENAEEELINEAYERDRKPPEQGDHQLASGEKNEFFTNFSDIEDNELVFEDMLEAMLNYARRLEPICDHAINKLENDTEETNDTKNKKRFYNKKDRPLFWIETVLNKKISGSKNDIDTVCVVYDAIGDKADRAAIERMIGRWIANKKEPKEMGK